jgi:uncharacterized protein (DUF302 family)
MTKYGFSTTVSGTVATVVERVTQLLAREGFGVLTRIDVDEVLRRTLEVERPPYVILGACNPQLAHEALGRDVDVGLLLPCNVVVRQADDEARVTVAFMDPRAVLAVAGEHLQDLADEARARLMKVRSALEGASSPGSAAP